MTRHERRTQSGFSLIELMVAMVVTLIISGAIFGLLASGQSAFRREPELSDRQQNVRLAMAMIEQDITNAGLNLGVFTQIFTPGLDGGAGPDQLEAIVSDAACPATDVCNYDDDGTVANVEISLPAPACFGLGPTRRLAAVAFPGAKGLDRTVVGPATWDGTNPGVCGGNPVGQSITLGTDSTPPAPADWMSDGVPTTTTPVGAIYQLVPVEVVRYRIFTVAPDTVPSLWRSTTGGLTGAKFETPVDPPSPEWQLVARGIEDLQVAYMNVDGAGVEQPADDPPLVAANDYTTIVRRVRVTLRARTTVPLGATVDPNQAAQHGELSTFISPRGALLASQYAPASEVKWK
jgi:prepilin-type N-terminal cleavage/methylation domain-containing protein